MITFHPGLGARPLCPLWGPEAPQPPLSMVVAP